MSGEDDVAELRDLARKLRDHARRIEESGGIGVSRGPIDARSLSPLGWERAGRGAEPSTPDVPIDAPGRGAEPSTPDVPIDARPLSPQGGERAGREAEPSTPASVRLPMPQRLAILSALAEDAAACTKCRLHTGRTRSVFARGSPGARVVFVGEGPGRDEDIQGAPFVGPAGQLLDKMIAGMGLDAESIYICNVVKCRPPNNRVPMADEAACCEPYLSKQIEVVGPDAIVALGKTAVSFLLGLDEPMARLRGRWHSYHGTPVMPTFHPAFLLRSPQYKREVWEDLKLVLARLGLEPPARGRA